MNKIKNISFILLAFIMGTLYSCGTDNIGPEYKAENGALSFVAAKENIRIASDATDFTVTIWRGNPTSDATYNISNKDELGMFSVPSTVEFQAGESDKKFEISFAKDLDFGTTYDLVLSLSEEDLSKAAISSLVVSVSKEYTWKSIGKGVWTDGLIPLFFGVPVESWEVDIEEANEVAGVYRIVNPYGVGVCPYTEEGDVTKDPCYFEIDASNPEKVFTDSQSIGLNWGYGEMTAGSVFGDNIASPLGVKEGKTINLGKIFFHMGDIGPAAGTDCKLILP